MLPEWMQRVARLLPTTYVNEALQAVIVRGEGLRQVAAPLLLLVLTSVCGIALDGFLFRWESTEPVRRSRMLVTLAVLGALYVGAYFLAPSLGMAHFRPKS